MGKEFGYPEFDAYGEKILCSYDNEYSAMMKDVRVYRLRKGETRAFRFEDEEVAVSLLEGSVTFGFDGREQSASRESVFTEGPWCVHVSRGNAISVMARGDSEIIVIRARNERSFPAELYRPEDAPWSYTAKGKFGGVAQRRVRTVFDHDSSPLSNIVLGECLNDKGNWSGYPPHRHPQPETYYFKFDRPEGFGASFVGDRVYMSKDGSFAAIPGGELHPQAVAPGFQMHTTWMIRHLDGNPWLQSSRFEDEKFLWLNEAE